MPRRIHIFGASGSGTTTLGEALGLKLNILHLDTDNYYWKPTDPPFREKCEPSDRIQMIENDISGRDSWILSGSICSWGDPLLEHFTVAVFLYLEHSIRMVRLEHREALRYGTRIQSGGDMHHHHLDFMTWAKSYDTASAPIRSFDLHEKWMTRLTCPIVRLDSDQPVNTLIQEFRNTTG